MIPSLRSKFLSETSLVNFRALTRDLPGQVAFSHHFDQEKESAHIIEIQGRHPKTQAVEYDCRFRFDFSDQRDAQIKNFSIHDSRHRGGGLGALVVRNLYETARNHPDIQKISLSAELERGAFVWARMGWLPDDKSFTRLQKNCQPKLDALQVLLPPDDRLSPVQYGIFRDLLDPQSPHRHVMDLWAVVDSAASYDVTALQDLRKITLIEDKAQRQTCLRERLRENGQQESLMPDVEKVDKTLRFLKELDLDGLARGGRVSVAMTLLAWEQWKGTLDLGNAEQRGRLESRLAKNHSHPLSFGLHEGDEHHSVGTNGHGQSAETPAQTL